MESQYQPKPIRFEIYGQAIRARHRSFKLPTGQIKVYDTPESKEWKSLVKLQVIENRPDFLWDGPVGVSLTIYLLKPKSTAKKVTHPIKRPDLEQLIKPILDAFKNIFYKDDSQIVFLNASKSYCYDAQPRIEVQIWREHAGIKNTRPSNPS